MDKTPAKQRLLLPDIVRGVSLLGIAAANSVQAWITTSSSGAGAPGDTLGGVDPSSGVDAFFAVFSAMFVHVRGLPMFSTLLGFGFGLVVASLYRKHYPLRDARRVLLRRYGTLAALGLIHMLAIFYGDIMLTYGLIGVLMALLFTVSAKWLRLIAYILLGFFAVTGTAGAFAVYFFEPGALPDMRAPTTELLTVGDYFSANFSAAMLMLTSIPFAVGSLAGLSIIGYVWATEGYLVNVDKHRAILRQWVYVAVAITLLLGLPWGLAAIGVIDPGLEEFFWILNQSWGPFTGPGILAAFALATNGMKKRAAEAQAAPGWAYPLIALGKRSMSGYLAQSLLFIVLVSPFGFGLGLDANVAGKLGVGLLVWLITLLLASVLEATRTPGPFEWVHRHLAYGRTGAIEPRPAHA